MAKKKAKKISVKRLKIRAIKRATKASKLSKKKLWRSTPLGVGVFTPRRGEFHDSLILLPDRPPPPPARGGKGRK
jgi:hypothetical protein